MIDCFARKNRLDEAENIYTTYCHTNDNIFYKFKLNMLLSILSSCRNHGDEIRAQRIYGIIESIRNEYNVNTNDDVLL